MATIEEFKAQFASMSVSDQYLLRSLNGAIAMAWQTNRHEVEEELMALRQRVFPSFTW